MKESLLRISAKLMLPISIVTQKLAFLGTTGSGKTYGASKLAELFHSIGAQFVVLDPVGVWWGLRLGKDGKKPSKIGIPVFGGLHGDVPLESTGGALIADLIVDTGISVVLDVSQFESDAQKAKFATDFADRFFFRKKARPSAVHLFLEECQEFVPQNPQKGEERMLHAFIRMQKLGRNFGIGSSYITQRPQEVNKKALNMAQTLFVFRNTGTHERNAIEKWIEDKSLDESIAQDLPKLPTGTCHVWSPEFLKISETVEILEKETFNASATPEVGQAAQSRILAPIDLEKVRKEMAATIEKAKAEDPKLLKERIRQLERDLADVGKKTSTKNVGLDDKATKHAISIAVAQAINETEIRKDKEFWAERDEWLRQMNNWFDILKGIGESMTEWRRATGRRRRIPQIITQEKRQDNSPIKPHLSQEKTDVNSNIQEISGGLSGPEQRVLDAVAWMENIGVMEPDKSIVAFLSGYAHLKSKGFTNPCSSLRTRDLIIYPTPGKIALTESGRALANFPDKIGTVSELHEVILGRLDSPKRRVLEPVLRVWPEALDATTLAKEAGYEHEKSKGFTNPRSDLRRFGLIDYPSPGMIKAEDILFPKI